MMKKPAILAVLLLTTVLAVPTDVRAAPTIYNSLTADEQKTANEFLSGNNNAPDTGASSSATDGTTASNGGATTTSDGTAVLGAATAAKDGAVNTAALKALSQTTASIGSLTPTTAGKWLDSVISKATGLSPAAAQNGAKAAIDDPNNRANSLPVQALVANGTCDPQTAREIGAAVGAVADTANEKSADEIRAITSLPPTSTLACDQISAMNIANAIIDVTGKSGMPTQIFQQAALAGPALFSKNLSVSVNVADVVGDVLNGGWKQAAVGVLSSIAGVGGGARLNPNNASCKDSLSKITEAMRCVTRVTKGGNASASRIQGSCLNEETMAAITAGGLFKKNASGSATDGTTGTPGINGGASATAGTTGAGG